MHLLMLQRALCASGHPGAEVRVVSGERLLTSRRTRRPVCERESVCKHRQKAGVGDCGGLWGGLRSAPGGQTRRDKQQMFCTKLGRAPAIRRRAPRRGWRARLADETSRRRSQLPVCARTRPLVGRRDTPTHAALKERHISRLTGRIPTRQQPEGGVLFKHWGRTK